MNVTTLTLEQFQVDHPNLIRRIFGHALQDGPTMQPFESTLFPNEGWRVLLLPGQINNLDKRHRWDEPESRDAAFTFWRPVNWLEAIMTAHWTRPEPYVFQAYTAVFDKKQRLAPDQCVVSRAPAIAEEIVKTGQPPDGPYWSEIIFDPRGEWGMIDIADEPATLLGAKGPLFDGLAEVFGGIEEIRSCFSTYLEELEARNRVPGQDRHAKNETYLAAWHPIYDRIGWPWPFPDHIGKSASGS